MWQNNLHVFVARSTVRLVNERHLIITVPTQIHLLKKMPYLRNESISNRTLFRHDQSVPISVYYGSARALLLNKEIEMDR